MAASTLMEHLLFVHSRTKEQTDAILVEVKASTTSIPDSARGKQKDILAYVRCPHDTSTENFRLDGMGVTRFKRHPQHKHDKTPQQAKKNFEEVRKNYTNSIVAL